MTTVTIPRKAKPAAVRREIERQPSFRRLGMWRTDADGRISALTAATEWTAPASTQRRGPNLDRPWDPTHSLVHLAAMT